MKNFFAVIGVFVMLLLIIGSLGIGDFSLYYGDDPHGCAKLETHLKDKP